MDVISILLENPVQVVLSVVALGFSGYAALTSRDNKREIRHHKEIDEALHGQMLSQVDGVAENLREFAGKWERENERDRSQRGDMWSEITKMRSDISYLKGRAEQTEA